jgi:Na+-transporting methylmalonyl-CoA/oxaloacetate decarboxylase gamma subunit
LFAVDVLCVHRNLVGGAGPVAVAKLAEVVGLQHAMLLAPACYVVSGLIFLVAEKEIEAQQKAEKLAAQQEAEEQQAAAAAAAAEQQQQAVAAVVTEPQQLQAVAVGVDSQKQQKQQQS